MLLRGGAVWIAGCFVEDLATWSDAAAHAAARLAGATAAELEVPRLGAGDRIARADRVTQLGALALARALEHCGALAPVPGEQLSVLTASALATAFTNERFERRRLEGRAPEPRSFPYTAPNAAAGEFAIALGARGPTVALVGGAGVALEALATAERWIARGRCRRAVVVATECLPEHAERALPPGARAVECAAAVVVEAADAQGARGAAVSVRYAAAEAERVALAGLSVDALARVCFAARGADAVLVRGESEAGAALEARVAPAEWRS
jgi:3-oxoacyl-[acyl-carrier-protein] synthase II